MKTIGFIDYFIDEFHANHYPKWIQESSRGSDFCVTMAWEKIPSPTTGKSLDAWCAEQNIAKAASIAEVVESCDYLVVLAPDDPQQHEELSQLPLGSGKPVYIDKPMASTVDEAERLFLTAQRHGTPVMSSSALRFTHGLEALRSKIGNLPIHYMATRGGGTPDTYAIHQIEMIVSVMGIGATRVRQVGTDQSPTFVLDFYDGRRAVIDHMGYHPFEASVVFGENKAATTGPMDDFFPRFIEAMLTFFESGQPPFPAEQTLCAIAIREAVLEAVETPEQWIPILEWSSLEA